MSKQVVKQKIDNLSNIPSGWDLAILDAKRLIQDHKTEITDLQRSITAFERLRDSGERFPGDEHGGVTA